MKKLVLLLFVLLLVFISCEEDSSIGVIGGADGPTEIIVSRSAE